MALLVRRAVDTDVATINAIANEYIETSAVNFDTEAWSLGKRREWVSGFNGDDDLYHLLVAEYQNQVVGFCCNTRFRPKVAYNSSTETTVYLDSAAQGKGFGRELLVALLAQISDGAFHRAYAVITLPNPPSVHLHESLGFTLVGVFDEIGWKFNQYHSVAMYQKCLS